MSDEKIVASNADRVARQLINTPIMMEETEFSRLMSIPVRRRGDVGIDSPLLDLLGVLPDVGSYVVSNGVAIIDVMGTMVDWRYDAIQAAVSQALSDKEVLGILLNVNSGGGSVDGNFDLVDFLYEAGQEKPMWAIANHFAASAAFNIASAASNIGITKTAGIGSVGVIAKHLELSKMDEKNGLTYTTVFAGARKNDFSDTEPLSMEARATLQKDVDELYEMFTDQVARNRGLSFDSVRDTEAAVLYREDALAAGFADEITEYNEFLSAFQASLKTNARPTGGRSINMAEIPHNNEVSMSEDTTTVEETGGAEASVERSDVVVADLSDIRDQVVAETREELRAEVLEISQLCEIAGCPDKVAEFVSSGATPSDVRAQLVNARAESADTQVNSANHVEDFPAPRIDAGSIYKSRAAQVIALRKDN